MIAASSSGAVRHAYSSLPTFDEIIAALPHLKRRELETIRTRAALVLQHKSSSVSSVEEEDWILLGIMHELSRRGLEGDRSTFRIRNSSSYAGYSTRVVAVRTLLEEALPDFNQLEFRLLGQVAAKALAEYISWRKEGIRIKTMLSSVGDIPSALDKAFPGYLEAGLLGATIRHQFKG
jgi:hypothetical protein